MSMHQVPRRTLVAAALAGALAIAWPPPPARAACPCCSSIHDPGVNKSVKSNGNTLQDLKQQNTEITELLEDLRDGLGRSGSRLDFAASIAPRVLPDRAGELLGPDGKPRADLASRAAARGQALLRTAFGGTSIALADLPPTFGPQSGLDLAPSADAAASPAQLLSYARSELGIVGDPPQARRNTVQERRRVEHENAVDTAWAVGVHHLEAARTAPQRLDEATRSIDGATDLRSQVALNTQAILAVVEQMERLNELMAAFVRMEAAAALASTNLQRHAYLGRTAVGGAPAAPQPWSGATQ